MHTDKQKVLSRTGLECFQIRVELIQKYTTQYNSLLLIVFLCNEYTGHIFIGGQYLTILKGISCLQSPGNHVYLWTAT